MNKSSRTDPLSPSLKIDNAFYDRLGDLWWDPKGQMSALHEMTPVRLAYFDGIFRKFLGPATVRSGRFLDVGCGGGILTEAMAQVGYRMVGIDVSRGALQAARRHARVSGIAVTYGRGSAYHLGIKSGSMDGVVASDLFEHLYDLPRAVSEAARVLRNGGVLAFDTVNRTWLSLIGAVWLVQKWLHLMPLHTHNWNMFITPGEMQKVLSRSGLQMQEIHGLSPVAHPLRLAYNLWKKKSFGRYEISSDLRISYLGFAVKSSS